MIAALSLLLILGISFFLIRLAAVALKLTGMPEQNARFQACLLYTSPSPRDRQKSRMPSSA